VVILPRATRRSGMDGLPQQTDVPRITAARSQSLPDVPTFQEAGIKGLVLDQWLGVFLPAGTSPAIVARLNTEIGKVLADSAIRANLVQSAQEPIGGTAEAFADLVREDFRKYGQLVQDLNIKVK
jgi:tripartite-type tricarboxylate transporter receptor subunit TctC